MSESVNEVARAGGDTSPATKAENAARLDAIEAFNAQVAENHDAFWQAREDTLALAKETAEACAPPMLSAEPLQLNPNALIESVPNSEEQGI